MSTPLRLTVADAAPSGPEPLAVGAKQLAGMLSLSLRTIRGLDAAGKLPRPVAIGNRRLWVVSQIRDWLEAGTPDRATWERMKGGRA